jgi:hypothetical protein
MYTCFVMAKPILVHQGETWSATISGFFPRLFTTLDTPYRWLHDPDTAMLSCVIPMV